VPEETFLIRILIVDDHEVVRCGVRSLLSEIQNFDVCGDAIDGRDAVAKAKELKPDVVVMDVSMPNLNGLEATRLIRDALPQTEVLILSQHEAPEMIRQVYSAGARGYLVKSAISASLQAAVERVSRHEPFFADLQKSEAHLDVHEVLQRSAAFESALRESEERFRSTFEQAAVGIGHIAPEGHWLRANQKLAEITGYSPEELGKVTYHQITHPEDLSADEAQATRLAAGEIDYYVIEKRYIRKDGSPVWVNVTCSGVRAAGKLKYFISVVEDINARKTTEEIAHRLAAIVESSDDAIVSKDLNGIITTWNAAAQRMLGYSPAEAIGKPINMIVPPEKLEEEKQIIARLRAGERIDHYETLRVNKAGEKLNVSLTISPVRDSMGRIIGASKIVHDTAARTQAEQAQARLAAIVESSDDIIVSKDLNGIIRSWNPAAERTFGYSAKEAVGQHITLIIPSELRDEEAEIIRRLRNGDRIEHFETVRVTKAGKRLNVSLTVSPIRDSQGKVIGASKIARDITQRKLAEKELRENQELLRAAFTQTYSFLAILSTDGTIVEANRAALEGTGFQRGEVIGHKLWDVWWQSLPEEQTIARTSVATAAKGLAVREECQYALRDGTLRFADRTLNPVQSDHGEVVMIVASGLDITEHRQLRSMLEERVHDRTRELEAKNLELLKQTEVVRELSARLLQIQDEERRRIARELHDSVGQMLAAVSMNLSHLHREARVLTPGSAKALDDNIGLVEQISTEIRTISHLLHPPLLDEVGLQSALRWYIDGFSERSKISVDLELPDSFGRLPRNLEITLFRVVQECLTNIHRHSGSSTAAIRVDRSENEVRLEVRDAGKGMPAETQTNLGSGKLSGVGLRGMSERLRQMGGHLEITSNGTGTQVLARLPIELSAPKPTATATGP
jgi:PAS domain S-box-containing protein